MTIIPVGLYRYNINNNNNRKSGDRRIASSNRASNSRKNKPSRAQVCLSRYFELKDYMAGMKSAKEAALLSDKDYTVFLNLIKENPQRLKAVLDNDSKIEFEKQEFGYGNIQEDFWGFTYSNGRGFNSFSKTTQKEGENKLSIIRKDDTYENYRTFDYTDESSFNKDYNIKNKYKEVYLMDDDFAWCFSRDISIKDQTSRPVLHYSYKKSAMPKSDFSKCIINDKPYTIQIDKNARVKVIDASTIDEYDLSKKLDFLNTQSIYGNGNQEIIQSKINSQKTVFINALKALPPQILYALGENYDVISPNVKSSPRVLRVDLYSKDRAVKSIINGTIEMLAVKNGLIKDKKLIEIFKQERQNYTQWLKTPKEKCTKLSESALLAKQKDIETDLMETIKLTARLLWTEEYEKGRAGEEEMRLLLNFYPETVSYIISKFELNDK